MMKNKAFKKIFTFLMALALLFGLSATAFAADSSVTFKDGKLIVFEPGDFTATDLFDSFKGLMPGDVRLEEIIVKNEVSDFDYIKVYMKAVLHTGPDGDNPISPEVFDVLAKDTRRGNMPELDYMRDFLAQLRLTVERGGETVYAGSPDELDGLAEPVYLGELKKGQSGAIYAELTAPIEMGSAYADRIGEVDWVFLFEGFKYPEKPKTGDTNNMTLWIALLAAGLAAGAIMISKVKKMGN